MFSLLARITFGISLQNRIIYESLVSRVCTNNLLAPGEAAREVSPINVNDEMLEIKPYIDSSQEALCKFNCLQSGI